MIKVETKNPKACQYQSEYAVYMMLGSCFAKAECTTKRVEKRLFLHYQDLSMGKQEKLEKKALLFMEKELIRALAIPQMNQQKVTISFLPQNFGNLICIKGIDFAVTFAVRIRNGKYQYAITSQRNEEGKVEWLPKEKKDVKKIRIGRWIAA